MIWHYDHRYNFWIPNQRKWHRGKLETVEMRPPYPIRPKSWITLDDYEAKFADRKTNGRPDYFYYRLAYRIQSSLSNQRTFVATIIPRFVAAGNSLGLLVVPDFVELLSLCAMFNSLVYDFVIRTKVTSNLSKFYIEQLPYPSKVDVGVKKSLAAGALRLCSTTRHFDQLRSEVATELCGELSPCIQEKQRRHEKALIDALSATMFDLSVDDFREIVRHFPLVDRHLRELERQPIIALRIFEAMKQTGHLPESNDRYEQEPVREFSNPWEPPQGWGSGLIEDDGLLNEELWQVCYGHKVRVEDKSAIERNAPKDLFGNPLPPQLKQRKLFE
jgi:hypothetical protein